MMTFSIPDKEVFSYRETGRILGVSHHTIHIAVQNGNIATLQGKDILGNPATWRVIPRSEVERLARQKGLLPPAESQGNL